ncbi:hypothetical protein RO07_21020 [Pandoraea pulmonicola]|uniref:Autotransporter domain-containing protein n=1 Tax=Pandoraea pulmonicola TaxID=93221 RepID=A0ABN4EVR5_PANPU|nr:hypothetical protein RO07_21020 [Pandoraea pulmonicola]
MKGTAVVGRTGSAVLVQSEASRLPTNANILVADGATLTGGNGNALEANGNVTANTTFDNAQIKGNVVGDGTATINLTLQNNATFTGDLTKVTSLAVNSNATWLLTTNSSVPTMTMNGGNVALSQGASNGSYRVLTVGALSGTGTFLMNANLGADAGDLLNVTGNATGNYQLKIRNTGAEPSNAAPLTVVRTGGGDAQFSTVGNKVDVGVYTYTLGRQGNDWVLSPSQPQSSSGGNNGPTELSASARTAIGISSVAPTIWYAETNVLRSRLGELRLKDGKNSGVWARAFGKQYRSRPVDGVDFRQTTYGVVGGADLSLGQFFGGTWLAGVLLGTSHSNLTFDGGSKGGVDSYTAGLYSTWLGGSGYYLDGTLRFNRFQNDADARMNDGAPAHGGFQNNGIGLTLEFGRHIEFGNSWFVEPYIQGSMLRTGGADFTLDNALSTRSQHTGSVQARVGAALGKTLEMSNGVVLQPYVKAAVAQEFIKNSQIQVNGVPFQSDMSGARFEFGAGMSGYAKRNLQFYGEVETSTGRHVNQPWGVQFGTRYTF